MWKKLALSLLALAVGLTAAEVVLRLTGTGPQVEVVSIGRFRYSPNPELGYEPVPGFSYDGEDLRYFEFRGRSNSMGFRDVDHAPRKAAGALRVLVLGDSVAMGLHVHEPEGVVTTALQAELRRRGYAAEVINFGVSGYNTRQEVAMLVDRGLALQPDIVLLQYSLNDTEAVNGGIIRKLREREQGASGVDWTLLSPRLMQSALYRLLWAGLLRGFVDKKRERRDAALDALAEDTVPAAFARLREVTAAAGVPVGVVVFPHFKAYDEATGAKHMRVAQLSQANGFAHLDLLDPFRKCFAQHGWHVGANEQHPSGLGNRCVAPLLASLVEGVLGLRGVSGAAAEVPAAASEATESAAP